MAEFSRRVVEYPVLSDSIKVASNAYAWASSGDRLRSIFELSEQAANLLKDKAQSLASTDAVSRMDEVACHQILDRIEAVCPHIKRPTEDLLGPVADRALTAAESYLEYFIPSMRESKPSTDVPITRYDRLLQLQSALLNSEKVQVAQTTITSAYQKMNESFNSLMSVEKQTREAAMMKFSSLIEQYQSAASIAFPKFRSFVDGAVGQTQGLITELRQTDSVSQFAVDQLRTIVHGLHSTLTHLNERREALMHGGPADSPKDGAQHLEMQILSSPAEKPVMSTKEEESPNDELTVSN